MAKLNKEYIQLLLQDKPASSLFWKLEKRIKQDKINNKVITFEALTDFSDELKEEVKSYLDFYI